MSKEREALKLALEALEKWGQGKDPRGAQEYITAAEEALAQPEQSTTCGEPMAYLFNVQHDGKGKREQFAAIDFVEPPGVTVISKEPLYTTPPQRTWVGLTPEEVDSLANLKVDGAYLSVPDTIRQTDAKLKEKNT